MSHSKRLWLAWILAPLTAPVVFLLLALVYGLATSRDWSMKSIGEYVQGAASVFVFGSLAAYAATAVVGLPAFLLLRKLGLLNYYTMALVGIVAATVYVIVVDWATLSALVLGVGALLGWACATVFWMIGRPRNKMLRAT